MYFHSSAAKMVAPAITGGSGLGSLSEPLIPKNEETREEDQEQEGEAPIPLTSIGVIIGAVLLGAAGIAASTMAMVSAVGMVAVYVAGGFGVLNSLTVMRNQYQISKGKGYREGANQLRREANRLADEVDALSKAVNDLETEANLMKTFESQLIDIARKQGVSVDKIVSLTRENEEILAKQKTNLKQTFLSDIAKAFISSEFLTGDMTVDLKNLPLLTMRLQIQLNSHGMHLDTDEFEAMVRDNNDIGYVIKKCGEMLDGNNDKNSSLVTVTPEYSKGSLEVARGGKPSLKSKPKLEHRNTVVREVKRGLSLKGIDVDSGSDSSVDSDYDSEADRLFGPRAGGAIKPRSDRKHRPSSNAAQTESKSKAISKFKAAARLSRFHSSFKREEDDAFVSRSHISSGQQRNSPKGNFKAAAVAALATRSSSKSRRASIESETESHGSSRGSKDEPVQQRNSPKGNFKAAAVAALATRSSSKSRGTNTASETESHGSSRSSHDGDKKLLSKRISDTFRSSVTSITSETSADGASDGSKNSRARSVDGGINKCTKSGTSSKRGGSLPRSRSRHTAPKKQVDPTVRSRRRVREGSF